VYILIISAIVMILFLTAYIHQELVHLANQNLELESISKRKENEVQALSRFIKDKDAQVRGLRESQDVMADSILRLKETVASLQAERSRLEVQAAKQVEDLERTSGEGSSLRSRLQKQVEETSSLRAAVEELEGQIKFCEEDRLALSSELNATRAEAYEIDVRSSRAVNCCDSNPMCNLCRLRR